MSETVLDALVKLFALIGDIHDETVITSREKDLVRVFLARQLNNELVTLYMKRFEEYLAVYNSESITKGTIQDRKRVSLNAMRILSICEKLNEELQQKQKIYVLVQLSDFISLGTEITENELDFLRTISNAFYIPESDFNNIRSFIMDPLSEAADKSSIILIDNKQEPEFNDIIHICDQHLKGRILFLHIGSTNSFLLRYSGAEDLYMNGQILFARQTYIFDHGSSIRGAGIKTVYYSEVIRRISEAAFPFRISLDASNISYKFRHSENGIHNLDFHEETGKMIGILGGSGVGKSTTLSILNGTLEPQSGEVLINGFNLYNGNEKEKLNGVIGYVPQDDLLMEELTVFQNIWFNARMCLNNLKENEIAAVVIKTLDDFDLKEIADLKVGNPLKKIISGGQRKRINIALELLRQPTILFVDEPTSGLSSVDSEIVMNLLKEQTNKGKLVIVNIHQPSSDIYKMFDRIMIIDKGGYQVYYGNPTEAIVYFKTVTHHANPDEDQCVKCGNVDTDQILQIIEAKVIDEHGKATRIRRVTPEEWADKYRQSKAGKAEIVKRDKTRLPENSYSIPGLFKQSKIFFARDLLSKIADKQYVLISLIGPALLSLLLAYFTRHAPGGSYIFRENDNIPSFMFMCIITSLFFGLMVSSEEIVRDRKILKRESFLHLSWFSYLNSKILIMFIISAIQTLSFVIIGNDILGIRGMTFEYWLVLFTTSCFANFLGLNLSSAFNSVITIYIIIPFIIIPQLLFSGVMVKYDKLHLSSYSTREFVPAIGELMAARWSFEALATEQFKNNGYEKCFFELNVNESSYAYNAILIDKLNENLKICVKFRDSITYRDEVNESFIRLNHHIDELSGLSEIIPGQWKEDLKPGRFNSATGKLTRIYLDSVKRHFMKILRKETGHKDSIFKSLEASEGGKDEFVATREKFENVRLRSVVLDEDNREKTLVTPSKIIRKYQPGYMKATSKYGRAHFYAPIKMIGNKEISTYLFNLIVLWVVILGLYIALYYNLLQKAIRYFENLRFTSSD